MLVSTFIAVLALIVGAAAELFIYGQLPGLGWLLFTATFSAAVALLARRLETRPAVWTIALWGCAFVVSGAMVTYDASTVRTLGPWLCGTLLLLACWWTWARDVPLDAFALPIRLDFLADLLRGVAEVIPGVRSLNLKPSPSSRKYLLGAALAVPLLLVFGTLFALSDDIFRQSMLNSGRLLTVDGVLSCLRLLIFSALALGLLRRFCWRTDAPDVPTSTLAVGVEPAVVATAIALVDVLFAVFLFIQGHWLFGGHEIIALPGVTYASYTRGGFFELVAVAVIVLLLMIWIHACLRETPPDERRSAVWAGTVLALQTYGVVASAVKRLCMYTAAYGLSVARLYAAAGLVVICLLLALAIVALTREKTLAWLLSRLFYCGLIATSLIGLVNVEGLVARTNLAHTHELDVDYLASLSADVVPVLMHAASDDPGGPTQTHARAALARWREVHGATQTPPDDWRAFNLSRATCQRLCTLITAPAPAPAEAAGIVRTEP